ncbi:helix-turn-helix domain-containing protein [Phocaeicola sp.]
MRKYNDMNNLCPIIAWMLTAIAVLNGIPACAESGPQTPATVTSLPDSLITDDYVYDYTFSDFDKAERIMQELRKRKKLPDYRLDITEGDLYFNTGQYYRALKFYKRALESDSVRLDDNRTMEQTHRLISCYDCLHNETKKAQYVGILMKKAEQCGNKEMQSVAMFNMGKMLYYQGNKERGYDYMRRAADLMEQTDYKYKYDNLRYNYNTLLTFQELDRQSEEALRTLEALQEVVTGETGSETPMEGLSEKEKKAMYAHYAVVLFRLGRQKEAEGYYQKFLSTAKDYHRDDYLVMPYLFDRKKYDEVIRINSAREKALAAQGDTVTYHMTTIKKSLGQAYEEKGDYLTASRYFKELAVLRDSIKNREQESAALELATLYETHEKDLQLQKQEDDAHTRNICLWTIGCIALLLGILLWLTVRYNRKMRSKNDDLVGNIKELLQYKGKLYLKQDENLALQEEMRQLQEKLDIALQARQVLEQNPIPEVHSEEPSVSPDPQPVEGTTGEMEAEKNTGNEIRSRADKALYERIDYLIRSKQLYLDPDFSREKLAEYGIAISRNKLTPLMKQYAEASFPTYLNNLRLDHAARLLLENPNYSVGTIAQECGIPASTTFYTLFVKKFKITPVAFRGRNENIDNQ